jgi:hypothetical protein
VSLPPTYDSVIIRGCMTHSNETSEQSAELSNDQALIKFLDPDEAQILLDWARSEEETGPGASGPGNGSRAERVRTIVKEIDDLVGNRQTLVADDLEERMIALLVGKLDPKSQTCLEVSRDVAQVTAEKDHLEGVELVRRLTTISTRTLRLIAGIQPAVDVSETPPRSNPTSITAVPEKASLAVAARARPIPRPSKIEPRKPGMLKRLFGRK